MHAHKGDAFPKLKAKNLELFFEMLSKVNPRRLLTLFANRADPDQTALVRAAWSESTLFANWNMLYLILH